jgi:hypothetical protein
MANLTTRPSLFAVLELVRQRPSMYVGCSDSDPGERLRALEMLIAGYSLASYQHGLIDPGLQAYSAFPAYLEERFGCSMACGPIVAIRQASESDTDAWSLFWDLLADFRASLSGG